MKAIKRASIGLCANMSTARPRRHGDLGGLEARRASLGSSSIVWPDLIVGGASPPPQQLQSPPRGRDHARQTQTCAVHFAGACATPANRHIGRRFVSNDRAVTTARSLYVPTRLGGSHGQRISSR